MSKFIYWYKNFVNVSNSDIWTCIFRLSADWDDTIQVLGHAVLDCPLSGTSACFRIFMNKYIYYNI